MGYNSDAIIQSLIFDGDGGFSITWCEQRDMDPSGVIMLRNHTFPPGFVPEPYIQEAIDAIQELLDAALVTMRNDPQRIPGRS